MPYFVNLECWNLKYPPLKRLKVFFETFVGLLRFRSSCHTSAIRNCKASQSVLTAEWSGRLDVVINKTFSISMVKWGFYFVNPELETFHRIPRLQAFLNKCLFFFWNRQQRWATHVVVGKAGLSDLARVNRSDWRRQGMLCNFLYLTKMHVRRFDLTSYESPGPIRE